MIGLDFSQIIIAQATDYHRKTKEQVELPLLRHMTLNSILNIKERLTRYADDIVLCIDSKEYWRKDIFPLYKFKRGKNKEESTFDWATFYQSMDILIQEFKENLPYKVLHVNKCEADDLLAVLSMLFGHLRDFVIVSSDHDFLQLQEGRPKVKQWSQHHKKFLSPSDYNLFEHVIKGDSGDGVPNIFSEDDCFVTGTRQKSVYQVKLEEWKKFGLHHPTAFCTTEIELERFHRNMKLINFEMIPQQYVDLIIEAYETAPINKMKLFNYLIKHKLKKIMERGNF